VVLAGVLARTAGELAELLLQALVQLREIEVGEAVLDARIGGDQGDEGIDDLLDAFLAAETLVGGVLGTASGPLPAKTRAAVRWPPCGCV
jgi:hypothetical protein